MQMNSYIHKYYNKYGQSRIILQVSIPLILLNYKSILLLKKLFIILIYNIEINLLYLLLMLNYNNNKKI